MKQAPATAPSDPGPALACEVSDAPEPRMNGTLEDLFARQCSVAPCSPEQRFDDCVRDDAFAAYGGDADALDRTWCRIDSALSAQPEAAEPMVWRGGLRLFLSGFAYRRGNYALGGQLQEQGFADLDRAIESAPDNIGVRVQHMMSLVNTLPYASGERRLALIEQAQDDLDYRRATLTDTPSFHTRAELWAVDVQLQLQRVLAAEASAGTLDAAQAKAERATLLDRLTAMQADVAGSPYAAAAACWQQGNTDVQIGCLGCHESD